MLGGNGMMPNSFLELYTGNLEDSQHAFEVPKEELIAVIVVPDNHDVRIIKGFCMGVHFLQTHVCPWIVINVVKDHHQLSQVVVYLFRRSYGCSQ